jgi:hypothetical protein
MPAKTNEALQDSNFIGLQSYTEAQADIFFGRDEEIDRLTRLVQSNTLTIVFGKSGTGKTSLLNAGVFPKLRKDYCLPFRIRLEFLDDSPDLITQIKNVLKSEIDKYGFKVESYPTTETLWEYFHSEPLWKSITPILIFDQFEEIFTLAKRSTHFGTKEINDFWEELSDLIENSIPEKLKNKFLNNKEEIEYSYKSQKIKILFSFREEFLPEFENITSKIPSIKFSRFRLMPMNGNQGLEVITKTWKENIDSAQAHEIVTFLTNEPGNTDYDLVTIEPSLLSQVCSYIDKERLKEGKQKMSSDFLKKYPKEIILRSIYNEVLAESNGAIPATGKDLNAAANPVKVFVEDKLITDEGYRTKYVLNEDDALLLPAIDVLKQKYFLRDDGKSIELTHDVLAPLIKDDREERRKEVALKIAKQKAKKRATKIIIAALVFSILAAGAIWFFTTKKARHDKEVAEKETQQLNQTIAVNNIKLDSIKERINELVVDKNDTNKILALQKKNIAFEDSIKMLNQKMRELADNRTHSDSVNGELLRSKDASLLSLKHDDSILNINYAQLNIKFDSLNNNYSVLNKTVLSLKNENAQLNTDLGNSKTGYTTLKSSYDKLNGDYDLLKRNFDEFKSTKQVVATPDVQPAAPIDKNNLVLNLYSSKNETIPNSLTIYLIPDVSANKKIIRDSKTYDNHFDFTNLNKAQGMKKAIFGDNGYYFPDVAPGDYFIKICANYGPYKMTTKKSVGNETTRMDYSEIVVN